MPITADRMIRLLEAIEIADSRLSIIRSHALTARRFGFDASGAVLDELRYASESGSIDIARDAIKRAITTIEELRANLISTTDLFYESAELPRETEIAWRDELAHFKANRARNEAARRYQERLRRNRGIRTREQMRLDIQAQHEAQDDLTIKESLDLSAPQTERDLYSDGKTNSDFLPTSDGGAPSGETFSDK